VLSEVLGAPIGTVAGTEVTSEVPELDRVTGTLVVLTCEAEAEVVEAEVEP